MKVYDRKLLHDAVYCLLDPNYGESRIQLARECIREGSLTKHISESAFPVIYLISLAKDYPLEMLTLLDKASRKLKSLAELESTVVPKAYALKARRRDNAAAYRARARGSLMLECLKQGRILSKDETQTFMERKKREWKKEAMQYRLDHPELTPQQAASEVAHQITDRVNKQVEIAKKNPEFFKYIKVRA